LKSEAKRRVTRVEVAVRRYIEKGEARWSNKTVEQYSSIANVFFDHLGGKQLTQARLEEFLQHVLATLHPTTYNKYVAILKRLLGEAGYEFFSMISRKPRLIQPLLNTSKSIKQKCY